MKKVVLFAALAVMLFCQAAVAVDVSYGWNQYCSQYHFSSYPQSGGASFRLAYNGANFNLDFAGIKAAIDQTLSVSGDDVDPDDLMNASIENWH